MGSPTAHATTHAASTWNPLASANMSLPSASAPRLALERAQSFAAAPRRPRRYSGRIPPVQGPSSVRPRPVLERCIRDHTGRHPGRRLRGGGTGYRGWWGPAGATVRPLHRLPGTATRTTSWQRVQSETFMARISCGRSTPPPDTPRSPSTTPPVAARLAFRAPDGCNRPATKSKPRGTGAGPSIKESSPKQAPGPGAPQQPHSSRGEKTK